VKLFDSHPAAIEQDANRLLESYLSFVRGPLTSRAVGGDFTRAHARALQPHVEGYQKRSAWIIADPDFSTLPPALQDDVRKIAEECAAAVPVVEAAAGHDIANVTKIAQAEHYHASSNQKLDDSVRAEVFERLTFQRRKAKPPKS
jgi:hypothetical protein